MTHVIAIMRIILLFFLLFALGGCTQKRAAELAAPEPFRPTVRFLGYSGDPSTPSSMSFRIESGARNEFLKLGDHVANTAIKLSEFDASSQQLVVTDTITNQSARLTLPKPVGSPPTF